MAAGNQRERIPHSTDAEESLLGAMMLSRGATLDALAAGVTASTFYVPSHSVLFDAVVAVVASGAIADPISVAARLDDQLEAVGGPQELLRIQGQTPASANAPEYARIIRGCEVRREAMALASELRAAALDGSDLGAVVQRIGMSDLAATARAEHHIRDFEATKVQTRQVRWAWPGRLPEGVVAIIEGDPDGGKSTLAVTLGAGFTRGTQLPDSAEKALRAFSGPVNIGYITAEDDPAATLLPRFIAAGGDPRRLFFYADVIGREVIDEARAAELLSLPRHIAALRDWIERRGLRVCVIDVLSAFTDERVDSHNDASVRRMLTPLKTIAEQTGCLILIIRHLTKGRGSKAIYAGQGSIGYGAAARSVLTVAEHPTEAGAFVLAVTKGNLAPREWRSTIGYRIEGAAFEFDDGTIGTAPVVAWTGVVDISADEALAQPDPGESRSALSEAKEWLVDLLVGGPVSASEVEAKGKEAGHSWSTLRRAKDKLGVESQRVGGPPGEPGEWKWVLLPSGSAIPEGAQPQSLERLDPLRSSSGDDSG